VVERAPSRLSVARWALPLVLGVALIGVLWVPHDPLQQAFRDSPLVGPRPGNWLGVDGLGRDFGSRLWRGAGHSVLLASAALLLALGGGALLVWLRTVGGRWVERVVQAVVGLWVAVPVIFIGLLLLLVLRPSLGALVLAAGLGNLPLACRQLTVMWREQRAAAYVEASVALGATRWRLVRHTLLPNLLPDMAGLSRLLFALAVLELSGLAFLGLIGDPDYPELGAILKQNQAYLFQAPMLVVLPGLILAGLLAVVHASARRS
jgi:peptide/nickel transport system permease protein